jgi:hypothetical protein
MKLTASCGYSQWLGVLVQKPKLRLFTENLSNANDVPCIGIPLSRMIVKSVFIAVEYGECL